MQSIYSKRLEAIVKELQEIDDHKAFKVACDIQDLFTDIQSDINKISETINQLTKELE